MRFVLAVARRELRSSWHRLALFFLCIGIGVGSIVSLRSFTSILRSSTGYHARAMFGGDVRADSTILWTPEKRSILAKFSLAPWAERHTEIIELETMVRATESPASRPALVELRAVKSDFPLRGDVRLSNGERYSPGMLSERGALVSASLLNRLHLRQGDQITIGTLTFVIHGSLDRLPGNSLNFSPMPRVAIHYDAVEAAGLTGFGSRVHYAWLFTTPPGREETLVGELSRALGSTPRQSVGSFRFVENFLIGSLANIDGFSGLVGLSVLVLAGIGIASVTRVFVQQRLPTIAILKCLGGRSIQVLGAYLALLLALSLAGGLLGLVFAAGIVEIVTQYATRILPMDSTPALTTGAVVHGLVSGAAITALFAIPPLLAVRQVKPVIVLRRLDAFGPTDPVQLVALAGAALGLLGLAFWESGTYRGARTFVAGVATTAIVLQLAGTATMAFVRRLQRIPFFSVRHGLANLHRPGNQTNAILFAVGIGALMMIAVQVHRANLQHAFSSDIESLAADMLLVDIQKDQRDGVAASLQSLGARDVRMVPVVGARVVGLKWNSDDPARARYAGLVRSRIGGGFRVTYRPDLDPDETIVKGTYWNSAAPSTDPEVSVEERYAEWLMLRVGDMLTFDVAGRKIEARVTSVRRIDRRVRTLSSRSRFEVIFRPGVLENAPLAFISVLKGPPPGDARAALQNGLLDRFPNVTVVDILDDLEDARTRVRDVSIGISILGAFLLCCGILTLIGSVAMTKYGRLYQAAILKTIGARKRIIVRSTLVEYGVLGLLAGTIGAAAAMIMTWALSTYGNNPMPWWPRPWLVLGGLAGTTVLVMTVGVLSTWDVIMKKPLLIMREE